MRYLKILGTLIFASTASLAIAPVAIAEEAVAAPKYSSGKTTIGVLMADPQAKAVLIKVIPEFGAAGSSEGFERASGMTLVELKAVVSAYAPDMVTDARLAQLDVELAKLGAATATK